MTFRRVSKVSSTMGVTSGGIWNVDPRLLWLLNCVTKRRGLDMWESVRNLPCWCSHGLLPLCGTWQLMFVECGRSLNDSFGCVHFVSSPEIKRFQWMSTACIRQPLSLTPTLNSMLHSSLMTNVNSLMWLKECTSAFDLVEPFLLLIASPSSHLWANNTTQPRISLAAEQRCQRVSIFCGNVPNVSYTTSNALVSPNLVMRNSCCLNRWPLL